MPLKKDEAIRGFVADYEVLANMVLHQLDILKGFTSNEMEVVMQFTQIMGVHQQIQNFSIVELRVLTEVQLVMVSNKTKLLNSETAKLSNVQHLQVQVFFICTMQWIKILLVVVSSFGIVKLMVLTESLG